MAWSPWRVKCYFDFLEGEQPLPTSALSSKSAWARGAHATELPDQNYVQYDIIAQCRVLTNRWPGYTVKSKHHRSVWPRDWRLAICCAGYSAAKPSRYRTRARCQAWVPIATNFASQTRIGHGASCIASTHLPSLFWRCSPKRRNKLQRQSSCFAGND